MLFLDRSTSLLGQPASSPTISNVSRVSVKLMMTTTAHRKELYRCKITKMLVNTSSDLSSLYDLRSILCHQRGPESTTDITARFRSASLDLLLAHIWICLKTAFGFVFKNIYISPGFNFPYFRSSPLSISPC